MVDILVDSLWPKITYNFLNRFFGRLFYENLPYNFLVEFLISINIP